MNAHVKTALCMAALLPALLSPRALADPGIAPDEDYVNPDTQLAFSAEIGEYTRVRVHRFPQPGMGVSVQYKGPGDAEAFIYNKGIARIPTGVDSDAVRKEFEDTAARISGLVAAAPFSNAKRVIDATPEFEQNGQIAKVRVVEFEYSLTYRDGTTQKLCTWLLLTAYRNQFLKLLFTHAAVDEQAAQNKLRSLIIGFLLANAERTPDFFVKKPGA